MLLFRIFFILTVLKLSHCEIYRLSKNVKPIRYILTMEPFMEERFYQGNVIIEIKVLENVNNITFHKEGFEINPKDVKIINSHGEEMQVNNTSENEEAETYTILLENNLEKNKQYNLTIGNFSRKFSYSGGFFLEHVYDEIQEREVKIALTHFEPTGARKAFPCFDEPGLKAKFVINLIRKQNYHSLSNEELEKTENLGEGRFKDIFKETPIMPTYSLAFLVTDFKFSEKLERHRVFASPDVIESGKLDYALRVGVKTLQALENFLGVNYTLSKMDQVTLPGFPVHAMENWGLIIYREYYLLKTNRTGPEALQTINCYIAHEFAHQWFGNLVTAEWWDYLWLSESFAAYFHYHIASIVEPSWRLADQFLIEMVQRSFLEEEYSGADPLNFRIEYSGQYPPLHIMYQKGSSIIRMTEHFLTHDVFKKSLQIYLQKNQFSSVVPLDLYNAYQEAVDEAGVNNLLGNMTVADILTSWDSKRGYPVVTVTRNYTSGSITLNQDSPFATPRVVPINYVFSSKNKVDFSTTIADYWLTEENVTIDQNFPTDGWIIVNKQQTGYYRVNYDTENWNRIIDYMNSKNFTTIHPLNRAQLIDDAMSFAYKHVIPWDIPLRLCDYLIRERDYIPFASFYNGLSRYVHISGHPKQTFDYFQNYTLANIIVGNDHEYLVYKEYLRTTLSGIADYFNSVEESKRTHLDKLHMEKFKMYRRFLKDEE